MRVLPLFALLSSCLVIPAYAAEPQVWLGRLAAVDKQSFHGTFVYERNGSFSTHAIWHQGGGTSVTERLLQLDGAAHEVVRVDGRPQCVSGALADQVADVQWPARHLDATQLGRHYEMRMLGRSRVAGRASEVLALIPRDQYRYAFELHLDEETALPLKSLLISEKGQLLERFQFVTLKSGDDFDAAMLKPSNACQSVRYSKVEVPASVWKAGWVPPGFQLNRALQRTALDSSQSLVSLLYEDGLARFTVFIEPLDGAGAEDARTQLGPTAVVSRRISTGSGDMMVTVVGEVPMGTAERVALSMQEPAQ